MTGQGFTGAREAIMPNWCDNRMMVVGPTDVVNEFVKGANKNVNDVDREMCILPNYLPFPPALEGKPVETDSGSFIPFTDRGYNWCLANWGTKWEDSGTRVISWSSSSDGETTQIVIYMNTAWGPPDNGIQRISAMFPELVFTLAFHEDGMGLSGAVQFGEGTLLLDIDGGHPPEYIEDDEDRWVEEIERMYDRFFAAAYPPVRVWQPE
jgi:hypothetical protein